VGSLIRQDERGPAEPCKKSGFPLADNAGGGQEASGGNLRPYLTHHRVLGIDSGAVTDTAGLVIAKDGVGALEVGTDIDSGEATPA
jgi:hypothetical protein